MSALASGPVLGAHAEKRAGSGIPAPDASGRRLLEAGAGAGRTEPKGMGAKAVQEQADYVREHAGGDASLGKSKPPA